MDGNPEQNRNFPQNYQNPNTQQHNSGLMRYRSAPSSYFSTLLDREFCEDFLHNRQSPETERILTRLISSGADDSSRQSFQQDPPRNEVGQSQTQLQVIGSMKTETDVVHQQEQSNFSVPEQGMYQQMLGSGRQSSNLIRHSSSPAGLFNSINIEGFAAAATAAGSTGMGNFVASPGESSFSSTSRFGANRMKYSSGLPTSSRQMSPIAEIGNRSMGGGSPDGGSFDEGHDDNYVSGFPMGSWDNMAGSSEHYSSLRGARDDKEKGLSRLNSLDAEDGEGIRSQPPPGHLAHHLSLPNSLETTAIDNASLLQDSVLCKIRAKRGCATHPRSIAERVRRTKISERIRKLQDLVPNMDKQTNTADMLDLAVEYIKDLQKQVKELSEDHAKCTCQNKHQYL